MLNAHPVRQPPQGKGRADEIMEFPGAVKGRGVVINVIVNVALVGMCADKKLVPVMWWSRIKSMEKDEAM